MMTNPTTNAICQRIGHRSDGSRILGGVTRCRTCGRLFRDDPPPQPLHAAVGPSGPAPDTERAALLLHLHEAAQLLPPGTYVLEVERR